MATPAEETVVITGCGWVTPFACGGIDEILGHLQPPPSPSTLTEGYWAIPVAFLEKYPALSAELRQDKGGWVTALAFEHARQQARQPDTLAAEGVGMVLGCALAGQLGMIAFANEVRAQSARFVSPIHFPQTVGNYIAGALARAYNIRGPNNTLAEGFASGLDAIVQGAALLAAGGADLVYAGGTDTLSPELAVGLAAPGALLSEGACLFVLERESDAHARGASPLAVIRRNGTWPADKPGDALMVTAGVAHPGAIDAEQQVGRCFAALGAVGVAAAIGAIREAASPSRAIILADADGAHATFLEISVPAHLLSGGRLSPQA